MNGDMKMELHFVCNLAFIFASLSVTKYIMKVCHSLFAKYHLRDFVTYYLRGIYHYYLRKSVESMVEISITYYLRKSITRYLVKNVMKYILSICHPNKPIIFIMVICLVH